MRYVISSECFVVICLCSRLETVLSRARSLPHRLRALSTESSLREEVFRSRRRVVSFRCEGEDILTKVVKAEIAKTWVSSSRDFRLCTSFCEKSLNKNGSGLRDLPCSHPLQSVQAAIHSLRDPTSAFIEIHRVSILPKLFARKKEQKCEKLRGRLTRAARNYNYK